MLLALIATKPRHGYELIKALEEKFGGAYSPSPGSVYPTLTLLEGLGLVRASIAEGPRRLFEITADGRAHLAENQATLDGITTRLGLAARALSGHVPPPFIHQAMHTLKTAVLLHRAGWTEAEAQRIREILEGATEAISQGPRA